MEAGAGRAPEGRTGPCSPEGPVACPRLAPGGRVQSLELGCEPESPAVGALGIVPSRSDDFRTPV